MSYWTDFWGASWRRTNPYGTPGSRAVYTKGYHRGEDIANNGQVADIPALRSGEVIDSGRSSVIGFWVCIKPDADPSRRDIYCHMFEPSAKRSGRVNAGDIIGRMATWGESPGTGWTGPHLHFVVSDLSDGGHNTSRADFDPRPIITAALANGGNAPAPAPAPAASGGQVFDVPGEGQYFYWQYDNALAGNYDPSQLLRGGQTLAVVENPGTGPVKVRCADGDLVWVGTRRSPAAVRGGTPAPAPAAPAVEWFDVPGEGQYFYWQYDNALAGNYDPSQLLRGGQTLRVVENPGTGPVKVLCADGDQVWVGTRRNPAATRRG
ncbi:M23 family metallopeptidase [Microbacterium sp. B24]|uniref:M23 family metallopeptidase n=1 Tax=Microbacterium sp. B24 TaxID=95616 RepID=UPI0004150AA6|nr:M23 family metallopeptidase [Microbacterium sp. B24]